MRAFKRQLRAVQMKKTLLKPVLYEFQFFLETANCWLGDSTCGECASRKVGLFLFIYFVDSLKINKLEFRIIKK